MSLPDFELHLGGGVYIDSAGNVRVGAPPAKEVPVYTPTFTLPVDPAKLKESVSSVEKTLKGVANDPKARALFERFGYANKILDVVAGAALIASYVAPVLAAAAFAVVVLKLLGVFKEGDSPFEASVKQSLETMQATQRIVFDGIIKSQIEEKRADLSDALSMIDGYYRLLKNGNPTLQQAQQLFADMNDKVQAAGSAVDFLLSPVPWRTIFDRHSYNLWWLRHAQMMSMSGAAAGRSAQAYFPSDEELAFDHRMMLPVAIYTANAYLVCLRAAHPEYRTTGEFGTKLRSMADKLDDLAEAMRNFGLGRIVYRREDFLYASSGDLRLMKLGDQWIPLGFARHCSAWPVGAIDLRFHDNAFFAAFIQSLTLAEMTKQPHPTKMAGIDFRWAPPAQLAAQAEIPGQPGLPPSTFAILNPDECAAAANAISEREYTDLVATSGYLELIRTAALVRNESSEPKASQTVAVREAVSYREPQAEQTVEISSGGRGWVEKTVGQARRVPQKFAADISVTTQPVHRPRPISYKVYLRTLSHDAFNGSWTERDYSDFYEASYSSRKRARDAGGAYTDQELNIFRADGLVLDEVLVASGVSSFDHTNEEREVELKVDSFDWWIAAIAPSFELSGEALAIATSDLNWFYPTASLDPAKDTGLMPYRQPWNRGVNVGLEGLVYDFSYAGWQSGETNWDGEKRDPKRITAKVKYELSWRGDAFRLKIETRPEDRNFMLFVIFEESLPASGKTLHTAVPVGVNGSLTYVPLEFYEREAKAIAAGGRAIAAFYKRMVVEEQSFEPSPRPKFIRVSPTDLLSLEKVISLSTELQAQGIDFQEMLELSR